ncbi:kinase-like protein [Gigaspora margarita]|uniref:Kinase-like protein n=1 Tax=Gigaspora margarita TaxID=4874 RepID=A0A8H3WZ00_GIGMA|nr:kinase-like protein [Gigaspora margarita]
MQSFWVASKLLIYDGTMTIAIDFGIFKKCKNKIITTRGETGPGVPAYIDPKYLADYKYFYNENSDVYSDEVFLWKILSGRQPFESCTDRDEVIYKIF